MRCNAVVDLWLFYFQSVQISETEFEQTLKLKCASRILSRKDALD